MGHYPTSYQGYPDDADICDVNVPNAFGGPGSLPDTESFDRADVSIGDAKEWNPAYDNERPGSYA